MDTFRGTLRMPGEQASVPVEARVDDLRLVLLVEGTEVGAWALNAVKAEPTGAGVVLDLGADRVELDITDRAGLLARLDRSATPTLSRRRDRRSERPTRGRRRPARAERRPRISAAAALVVGAMLAVVLAAVFFTEVTGAILLLVGAALLVVGALGYVETRMALRLPLGLAPVHFVLAGGVVAVAGAALILVG